MRKLILFICVVAILPIVMSNSSGEEYVLLSWNDLGMHCANKDFSKMCVLPPYNNLKAQVIIRGNSTTWPQVLTSGYSIDYSVPGNTYSVGKTNFWTYANALFGVTLAPNTGLTGVGLTGSMSVTDNYFHVEGIPITPYQDNNLITENPFQLTYMEMKNQSGVTLKTTQNVIPVSNEISCVQSGCHSSETQILNEHEQEGGFNPNNTPILCASCHSSNALGTAGHPGVPSLSLAIHEKHGDITNDCYDCHPGPVTQCFRDVMHSAGMVCQDCHGSVSNVAQSIQNGREPWLEEPACGASNCHGSNYAEEPGMLFRNSRGHGNLYCSACHGSPHAIQPTVQPNDNVQNISYQGFSGVLRKCDVCHGYTPPYGGPHGYNPTGFEELSHAVPSSSSLLPNSPNPFVNKTNIRFRVKNQGNVRLEIFDMKGNRVLLLLNENLAPGEYQVVTPDHKLPPGSYLIKLRATDRTDSKKITSV